MCDHFSSHFHKPHDPQPSKQRRLAYTSRRRAGPRRRPWPSL